MPHPSSAVPDSPRQLNVSFYSQHGLGSGEHTLTIINLNGTVPNIFWLDYLIVDPPNTTSQSSEPLVLPTIYPTLPPTTKPVDSLTPTPSSLATFSVDATVITIYDVNPSASNVSSNGTLGSKSGHRTNIAAIVGGIMAVFLVIAVVATIALIRRRCQARNLGEHCALFFFPFSLSMIENRCVLILKLRV